MDLAEKKGIKTDSHTIENPSNNPDLLKKSSPDVRFHDPEADAKIKNYTIKKRSSEETLKEYDVSAGKEMRKLLDEISNRAESYKKPKEKKKNNTKYTNLKDWLNDRSSTTTTTTTSTTQETVTEIVTEKPVSHIKKHHQTFDNIHKSREAEFGRNEQENIEFEK